MKFLPSLATAAATLLIAAGTTSAQNAQIGYPPTAPGSEISRVQPGQLFTIELDRPNTLTPSIELGVQIGLQTCQHGCHHPSEGLGTPLCTSPYQPQYHEYYKPQYQNFTVQIPQDTLKGPALLGVRRISLTGASKKRLEENFIVNLHVV